MSIAKNLTKVRATLPAGVLLVAVSKTRPAEAVIEAWRAGQRDFGENRPQEMAAKQASVAEILSPAGSGGSGILSAPDAPNTPGLPAWHQIGHLQTNKVKLIAPFVAMIHSVDSARLAREISRQALLHDRVIDILFEIRIARESTKEGWEWPDLTQWLLTGEWRELSGIRIRGLMGVATNTDDESTIRAEFQSIAAMHAELRERFFGSGSVVFDTLSMGMSDDYPTAVSCGATMVRIGSAIFGARGGNAHGEFRWGFRPLELPPLSSRTSNGWRDLPLKLKIESEIPPCGSG
jgi:pyridoxal phosphate enzyme (YggS family)